jgi:plastocyanin
MAFSPATLTVSVNTTVIWTNNDTVAHTVTNRII